MQKFLAKTKEFILDLLFPKFCLNCGREGSYLCQDCQGLIEVSEYQYCPFCLPPKIVFDGKTCSSCRKTKTLSGLYFAAPYDNFIVKKLIDQFKYQPYIKELSKPLSSLMIAHLLNLSRLPDFSNFILVPLPLHRKKLKQRGFNQAEEIGKELAKCLGLPIFNDVLLKIKNTLSQTELKKEEREKNIKGVFYCKKPELVQARKILLVDDIFTTGSTMEECALTLKRAGAKEVWGIVVARG